MANDKLNNLLITYLTTPKTNFYLSKLIQKCSNPALEPYEADQISLGTVDVMDIPMEIILRKMKIRGISHIQIKKQGKTKAVGNLVTFYADRPNTEAPPQGVPESLLFDADFILIPEGDEALGGHLHAEIKQAELVGAFTADSPNDKSDQVVIRFNSLTLQNAVAPGNMNIRVDIDGFFRDILNQIINTPDMHSKLVDGINDKLKTPDVLNGLNSAATDAARSALKNFPGGI